MAGLVEMRPTAFMKRAALAVHPPWTLEWMDPTYFFFFPEPHLTLWEKSEILGWLVIVVPLSVTATAVFSLYVLRTRVSRIWIPSTVMEFLQRINSRWITFIGFSLESLSSPTFSSFFVEVVVHGFLCAWKHPNRQASNGVLLLTLSSEEIFFPHPGGKRPDIHL